RHLSPERLTRLGVGIGGALLALFVVYELGVPHLYNLRYAESIVPSLVRGFELTVEIVGVVVTIGFGIGFLIGWARTTRSAILRGLGAVYVDFFRSMPPIVLIAFAYLIGLVGLQNVIVDPFLLHSVALW